jgi:anti-anti-sigma regulatory factor
MAPRREPDAVARRAQEPRLLRLLPADAARVLVEIAAARPDPGPPVVLDLSDIETIDTALLRALQAAGEAAVGRGRRLELAGIRPEIYKALHLARLAGLCIRR